MTCLIMRFAAGVIRAVSIIPVRHIIIIYVIVYCYNTWRAFVIRVYCYEHRSICRIGHNTRRKGQTAVEVSFNITLGIIT